MMTQSMDTDTDAWDAAEQSSGLLRTTREQGGGALQSYSEAPREWLFPDADEIFRGIYTRAAAGFANEVVAVCSAITGEGRTTVSVGLGVTMAQDFPDRRILVVETDSRRPVLAEDFDVEPSPGLIDCIATGEPVQVACRRTFLENLHIVPVGGTSDMLGRPLRSSRIAGVLEAMRDAYDVVILDLPPILVNSDAVLLTDLADAVVYVVRSGVTPLSLVNKAMEQLDEGKLRGIVINGTRSSVPGWLQRLVGM